MFNSKLTIIIPTYDSERFIKKTLTFLSNQTDKDFRVLIVDDNSTDQTIKISKSFVDNLNIDFIVKPKEIKKGAAASINYVFKNLVSENWALIDSDAYLNDNWVSSIKEELKDHKVVGAPIHALTDEGLIAYLVGLEIEERYKRLGSGYVSHLSTCNLAGRHEVLKFIDLDEKLSYAYDHQLSFQLRQNNIPIYLTKKTYCSHANKSGFYKFFIQQFKIAKHHLTLSKKMPREAIKGDEISPSYLIIQPTLMIMSVILLFIYPLLSMLFIVLLAFFNFNSLKYVMKLRFSYLFILFLLIIIKNIAWIIGSVVGLVRRSS